MKRKGMKTILTLCMAFSMLFGNVLTVSAEETTEYESGSFAFSSDRTVYNSDGSVKYKENVVGNLPMEIDGYELIGRINKQEHDEGYTSPLTLYYVKNGDTKTLYQMYDAGNEINLVKRSTASDGTTTTEYFKDSINITFNYDEYEELNGVLFSETEFSVYSGSIKLFDNQEDFDAYRKNGTGDYEVVKKPLEDSEMIFDENIPTPELSFINDGRLRFGFNNATDDYFVEIKGRWWTVDDIELYKENLMWKYKYSSLIKNDMSLWVDNSSKISAKGTHDLGVYGLNSFNELLTMYPVNDRNYTGGTNAIGNFISGYNDAMDTLKMLLNVSSSLYNSCEIYVRYYVVDENGNYYYGKWCHWLGNLAKQTGSSGSLIDDDNVYKGKQSENGLTDEEVAILENSGNSRNDIDLKEEQFGEFESAITGVSTGELVNYLQTAINALSDVGNMLGQFPALVARVVSFLPPWIVSCIGLGIVLVIILRIVGR